MNWTNSVAVELVGGPADGMQVEWEGKVDRVQFPYRRPGRCGFDALTYSVRRADGQPVKLNGRVLMDFVQQRRV